jgi:hypothetical protein
MARVAGPPVENKSALKVIRQLEELRAGRRAGEPIGSGPTAVTATEMAKPVPVQTAGSILEPARR